MGQTPWTMLNDLTERNMDAWKAMSRGLMDTAAQVTPPAGPAGPASPTGRGSKKTS